MSYLHANKNFFVTSLAYAVYAGPTLAGSMGIGPAFVSFAISLVVRGLGVLLRLCDGPCEGRLSAAAEKVCLLREEPSSWSLGFSRFLAFGGCAARSALLPVKVKDA